jgi:hypothetical protein
MILRAAVAAAGVMLLASNAGAVQIYAMNNQGNAGPGSNEDTLTVFDHTNPGGFITIGPTGLPDGGFGGLDFDGAGNLWGYVSFGLTPGLYSVNVNTGQATLQGNLSGQALQDLAYNPVDGTMYGVDGRDLYTVNLVTGAVTYTGTFFDVPSGALDVGLGCDSSGNFYIHDIVTDAIYKGTLASQSLLYATDMDTNYSQGLTVNWAGDNRGYHAALGPWPGGNYYSRLYSFDPNGGDLALEGLFNPDGTFPIFEGGDIAIIPGPGGLALLVLAGLGARRRRRG